MAALACGLEPAADGVALGVFHIAEVGGGHSVGEASLQIDALGFRCDLSGGFKDNAFRGPVDALIHRLGGVAHRAAALHDGDDLIEVFG